MREKPVEERLKERLELFGFRVVKLVTPGFNGVMDRLILRPKWSPGSPWFCECKRPRKTERRLQELRRDEMRERGCKVLDICDSYERVEEIVRELLSVCEREKLDAPSIVSEWSL